jgi:asparagine synthase (glutamine-hydrolysing)
MCGILAVFKDRRSHIWDNLYKLHRRGPDMSGSWSDARVWLGHTRLAIVGLEAGPQPIVSDNWVVVINGEIYNGHGPTDCYCVPELLEKHGRETPTALDGVFSFVAYNKQTHTAIVARDAIGVTPLYWATSRHGVYFSSLLTAIDTEATVSVVPPGHCAEFNVGDVPQFQPWSLPYNPWLELALTQPPPTCVDLLFQAVKKRLMGQVPWGVLLSGGLDSSILASIAVRVAKLRTDYPVVHTFCIGLKGCPDLHWAKMVAKELGTQHTSLEYTVEEGLAAIPEVVRAVETYDVTTVRASVPMWLLGRALKRRGIKMVLSGEGADELFAGYLYNLCCPSEREMVRECQRKMQHLHLSDCARANKTLGDWGVETRVPFLDRAVVDFAMNALHPRYKMSGTHPAGPKPEKWYLREIFQHIVPQCVVDRTKAQFSDAVGAAWIETLKTEAVRRCSASTLSVSNEAIWYKELFRHHFPQVGAADTVLYTPSSIACSSAAASRWHVRFQGHLDPSGDAVVRAMAEVDSSRH